LIARLEDFPPGLPGEEFFKVEELDSWDEWELIGTEERSTPELFVPEAEFF
jgi:hypothetical protein